MSIIFISLLVSTLSLSAQTSGQSRIQVSDARVRMPVLGYLVSESPLEVRALQGLPDSASLSGPMAIPEGAASVRFAPHHDGALVLLGESRSPAVWQPDLARLVPLPGADAPIRAVAFAPSGRLLVLALSDGRLLRYSNLPASIEMESLSLPQPVESIAVNNGGTWLAANSAGRLTLIDLSNGKPNFVYESPDLADFAFSTDSDALAIADAARHSALIVENGAPRLVWSDPNEEPNAVWLENGNLFLTQRRSRSLTIIDQNTLQPREVRGEVNGPLQRLRVEQMLLLTGPAMDSAGRFGYMRDGSYQLGFWSPVVSAQR
jgi:WD40 repeat protein